MVPGRLAYTFQDPGVCIQCRGHRDTGARHLILSVILLAPAVACLGPNGTLFLPPGTGRLASGEFIYPAQYFECELDKEGASARIAQAMTLRCTDGCIQGIRVVIPYGQEEIVQSEVARMEALTPTGRSLNRTVDQNRSYTEVWIELAAHLCEGQETVVILRYEMRDLPGEEGIGRPVLSMLDRLLGRDPSGFEINYRPGVFEEQVDMLAVSMFGALDLLPLRWEPEALGSKLPDPSTGRISIDWKLEEGIPTVPVFRLLLRKERGPDSMATILGLLILIVIIVLALAMGFPRRGSGQE